jgi:hypothetical protein
MLPFQGEGAFAEALLEDKVASEGSISRSLRRKSMSHRQ